MIFVVSKNQRDAQGEYMRVGIATDHGGFSLKEELLGQLRAAGHEVVDFGAHRLSEGDEAVSKLITTVPLSTAGSPHACGERAVGWRKRRTRMRRKGAPPLITSPFPWDEEGPERQIPYPVVRQALGKSGPVRIQGLALTRAGDTVQVRSVNPHGQPLQPFIERPWRP